VVFHVHNDYMKQQRSIFQATKMSDGITQSGADIKTGKGICLHFFVHTGDSFAEFDEFSYC
jgi:hypothetical protein